LIQKSVQKKKTLFIYVEVSADVLLAKSIVELDYLDRMVVAETNIRKELAVDPIAFGSCVLL
jgi:hypothetical protein